MRLSLIGILLGISFILAGCGEPSSTNINVNATTANSNAAVKLDPANLPDGLKPEAIPPSANTTPGIPPSVTNLPKGATPTPGIPDLATIKKGVKPGATPTPGIPSQEEIRKSMGQSPTDVNKPVTGTDQMMKKNSNKIQKPK
jgi:hypothetical protein